jgi:hypothetical protein
MLRLILFKKKKNQLNNVLKNTLRVQQFVENNYKSYKMFSSVGV